MAGLQRTEISTEIADFVWFSHSPERNRFGKELKLFVHRHTQGLRSSGKYFDEAIGHYGTGRDIIDVIPYGARSVAIILAITVTPARTESETTRSVRGSFTP